MQIGIKISIYRLVYRSVYRCGRTEPLWLISDLLISFSEAIKVYMYSFHNKTFSHYSEKHSTKAFRCFYKRRWLPECGLVYFSLSIEAQKSEPKQAHFHSLASLSSIQSSFVCLPRGTQGLWPMWWEFGPDCRHKSWPAIVVYPNLRFLSCTRRTCLRRSSSTNQNRRLVRRLIGHPLAD